MKVVAGAPGAKVEDQDDEEADWDKGGDSWCVVWIAAGFESSENVILSFDNFPSCYLKKNTH